MLDMERRKNVEDLCSALVREESLSGREEKAAAILREAMVAMGYDEVVIDGYGNCIGLIKGKRPGKTVLFDGHLDVVPAGDASRWTRPPYSGEVKDGKMWGRGTSDMKCAVGSMACAAAFFAEDNGRDFPGELYVVGGCHEECFEGVAAREVSARTKPDYVIIGEASQLNLKVGQRGRAEIRLETFGRPVHSSNPETGINAVYKMIELIDRVRKMPLGEHPLLGNGILELVDIKSAPYPGDSVVPEYCVANFDRRLLVGETPESVLAPIQAIIDDLAKADPDFKAKVSYVHGREKCYTGEYIEADRFFPAWLFSPNDAHVRDVLREFAAMGHEPEIGCWHFCTNGSHYGGEAGIKTLGFGPGDLHTAHIIDEYMPMEQLMLATRLYMGIMRALLK